MKIHTPLVIGNRDIENDEVSVHGKGNHRATRAKKSLRKYCSRLKIGGHEP